jgi:hypothetical protein
MMKQKQRTLGLHAVSTEGSPPNKGGQQNKTRKLDEQEKDRDPQLTQAVQTAHTSPWLMFFLGGLCLLIAIMTNCTQIWTSFSAFLTMLTTGSVFLHLKSADQSRALPALLVIAGVIALSVQTGVLMVAFRVDVTWRKARAEGNAKILQQAAATAVELAHQPTLILIYGAICFVANCLGDYGFIFTYSDSALVLFFWGLVLTAGSTLGLMEGSQYLWSGYRAWLNHKAQYAHIQQQLQARPA